MSIVFSARAEQEIRDLIARYPQRSSALVPVLFLAQREFGYLSAEVLACVAARLQMPESQVLGTATFYTMLHKQPVGRTHVRVCCNVSCFLRGADRVLEAVQEATRCRAGGLSADGRFSVEKVECLAACGSAPAMQIDDADALDLTPDRAVEAVLAADRAKEAGHA